MTTPYADLERRLREATGADRKIDARLFECAGLTPEQERHCADWCKQNGRTDLTRERYIEAWAPEYTKSVDAALSLVPEGWTFAHLSEEDDKHWYCELREGFKTSYSRVATSSPWPQYRAPTAAIAIVVASLEARSVIAGSK